MVIENYDSSTGNYYYVTITYDSKVIDAIRTTSTVGNEHYNASRSSLILSNLSILIRGEYNVFIRNRIRKIPIRKK